VKTRLLLLGAAIAAIALVQPLTAATDTKGITVSATVAATARLTLSRDTVAFPDADPDVTASIPATGGAVNVRAQCKTASTGSVTLTLQAAGDLVSGSETIAISNVTWAAAGGGFVAGTMSSTVAVPVGSWTGSGNRASDLTFSFANTWAHPVGIYSASATYTLTAP
jgi:hypothetical protein